MTFTNSEARRPCGPDCTKWNHNVDQASAGTALNGAPIRNENYSKWNSDKEKKLYEYFTIFQKYKKCACHNFRGKAAFGPRLHKMVPKRAIRSIYGDHGPNICIEISAPANRRRAEPSLYVLETTFTVQRILCTYVGKTHPVQKVPGAAKVWNQYA